MSYEIIATARSVQGTGASRRLRGAGRTPAVVYGAGQAAVSIELEHNTVFHQLRHESFHSSVLNLTIDGVTEPVLLRNVQFHPFKPLVVHVDFLRVAADALITMKVPFHFLNADIAPGVKVGGGRISHVLNEAEVVCLPSALPEYLEVNVGGLELGQSIHLSEIALPAGVQFTSLARNEDLSVAVAVK